MVSFASSSADHVKYGFEGQNWKQGMVEDIRREMMRTSTTIVKGCTNGKRCKIQNKYNLMSFRGQTSRMTVKSLTWVTRWKWLRKI